VKRSLLLLLYSLCGAAILIAVSVARSPLLSLSDVGALFAGVFFTESSTPEGLRDTYAAAQRGEGRIRVLIVPGHDDEAWGTEFRGVREADMNAAVGEELTRLLARDSAYEPLLIRSREGYAAGFAEYLVQEKPRILAFLKEKKQVMSELIRSGELHMKTGVIHNNAPTRVAQTLYAINAWANEHGVDIVLHIHFNDYPGRPTHRAGRYNGFSLYVPERQFSNARASRAVADALFAQLSRFYAESNLPVEDSGVVEDQELIAIGAYNTLDPAAVLIEYGYIYEQRFLDDDVRAQTMRELAFQTYQGLNRFFGKYGELFQRYPTTLLPHEWREPLSQGTNAHPSVLSLQAALLLEDLYPPAGASKRDCPLTGSFGPCTARAVTAFQERNGIAPASGTVGPQTLAKLNEKYSR
jgi:N-acetylmuramoyl-L-alanine amidase